jgi:putative redox protein
LSVKISGKYLGKKKVELLHLDSGSKLITDAPRDNSGDGSTFSPTDLIAAGLGACVLTTIAIVAERGGISVDGMHMSTEKHMSQEPRRIGRIPLAVHLPETLLPHERQKIERAGLGCPVHHSLHPEVLIEVKFIYDVKGNVEVVL